MKVPFIDLKRVASLVHQQVLPAWDRAAANTEFVGGPTVAALEKTLGDRLGASHVVSCNSGSDAILIALQALGVGPGKKVALPNLTFWATYEAVAQLGAIPVLIDIDPDDLQMDLEQFQRAFESIRFDAAVLVHLMGWATPGLSEFRDFCKERNIALVEDGAQSYGVQVQGRSVYSGAQVSTLSFYPAKVLGGCMNGGAVLTDDPELASLVRKLCNHGRSTHYTYSHVGWNSRMGALQAAWVLESMHHVDAVLEQRRGLEQAYLRAFAEMPELVKGYGPPSSVTGNGYLSVCTLKRHALDKVTSSLAQAGISVGRVYPETLDMQPPAVGAIRSGDLDRGRAFCLSVVNLPLFYGMTDEEFDYVQVTFARVLREANA